MKKIVYIISAFAGVICVGVILLYVSNYIKTGNIKIDPEEDYCLISEDNTIWDLPYILL
ncbi:hypothetical protein AALC75_26995 [Lachnospiraceae bacterium 48-42]